MRDDFNQKTKDFLVRRVCFVCSNPECRKRTSGPGEEPDKAVNIGVATHITAASEGGPRYDPFMSADERPSAENGIWLCQNCAHLIDADPVKYPIELLYQWKRQTEVEARASIGRRSGMSSDELLLLSEAETFCGDAVEHLRIYSREGRYPPSERRGLAAEQECDVWSLGRHAQHHLLRRAAFAKTAVQMAAVTRLSRQVERQDRYAPVPHQKQLLSLAGYFVAR